jgi:hypothetical protein
MRLHLNWESALSWIVLCLAAMLGFLTLAVLAFVPLSRFEREWDTVGSFLVLAFAWFISSLIATRTRRLASLILLVSAPIASFLMAHETASEYAQSLGQPDAPRLSPLLFLALAYFLPLYLLFLARTWRRALTLLSALAVIVTVGLPVPIFAETSRIFLKALALYSALFLAFAAFWFATYKFNWPPLLAASPPQPLSRRAAKYLLLFFCFGIPYLLLVVAFAMLLRGFSAECSHIAPPFSEQTDSHPVVFTVQIIRVIHDPDRHRSGKWFGESAIGTIKTSFWGSPRWPHLVLLRGGYFQEGETYFFDGRHNDGLLTQFLPVEDTIPCGRTKHLADAAVDLHLLNERPQVSRTMIIGSVFRPGYQRPFEFRSAPVPYAGAKIISTGPSGTEVTTAGDDGIYEIADPTSGNYTLKVSLPDSEYSESKQITIEETPRWPIAEVSFPVIWNGSIEGHVVDSTGSPAQIDLRLEKADGSMIQDPYSLNFHVIESDFSGSFHFDHIQAGSYKVVINRYGVTNKSPYSPTYSDPIEVGPAQHVKNITLRLSVPFSPQPK